jgi:predicted exporter
VLVSLGVIATAAIIAATEPGGVLRPDTDLTVMHPRPNPAIEAQAELPRRFGSSPGSLMVHLKAQSPAALVHLAHELDRRLSRPAVREAGVAGTYSLASLLPDPDVIPRRRAALPPAEVNRIIADFRTVIAEAVPNPAAYDNYADGLRHILTQPDVPSIDTLREYPEYRGLARSLLPSGALGNDEAGTMNDERTSGGPTEAITLVFLDRPDNDRAARDAVVLAGRAALADLPGATLTGLPVVSYDAEAAVRHDLPRLLAAAGLLTAGYLALHFRNVRDVLLAFLPTVFSLTCLAAVARLTGQRLNMVNLVALPLLLGIDVDYGIYLVTLARGGRSGAGRPEGAAGSGTIVARLGSAAYAVVVCATSIILGFGSLAFTSVPAVRSLGFVVAAGVFGCLLATFSLRVALLLRPDDVPR